MKDTVLVLDRRRAREYAKMDPRLHEITDDALAVWPVSRCHVSSIWRSHSEEVTAGGKSGIHETKDPHRAEDLSGRNINGNVSDRWRACGRVATQVNRKWQYDPRRPHLKVAVAAKHGTGPHVHLQVHPRSKRR
jgi:hypothetical protein